MWIKLITSSLMRIKYQYQILICKFLWWVSDQAQLAHFTDMELAETTTRLPLGFDDQDNTSTHTVPTSPAHTRSVLDNIFWSMNLYLTPVIIVVGLSGNLLSLIVFIRTPLRHLSSSVYLAALCIADSAFLVQLFAVWLIYVRVFIFHMNGLCQTFVYIMYVSSFLSVWFVVCFTVERYIVCIYPLKKRYICNVRNAKIVVISISIFAAALYSFGIWTSGVHDYNQCSPMQKYLSVIQIMGNIDTVITLVIPVIVIIFMNARIVARISQSSNLRSTMLVQQNIAQMSPLYEKRFLFNSSQKSNGSSCTKENKSRSFIHRSQLKTTKMLVTVSTIFVILNTPNHAVRMYITLIGLFSKDGSGSIPPWLVHWQHLFNFIYYINFSINLFLYSLCGQNFRFALKSLFFRGSQKQRGHVSRIENSRIGMTQSTVY